MVIKQNQNQAKAQYTSQELTFLEIVFWIVSYASAFTSIGALFSGYRGLFGQREVSSGQMDAEGDLQIVGGLIVTFIVVYVLSALADMVLRHLYGVSLYEKVNKVAKALWKGIEHGCKWIIKRCIEVPYYRTLVIIAAVGIANLLITRYVSTHGSYIMYCASMLSGGLSVLGILVFHMFAFSALGDTSTIKVVDENGKVLLSNRPSSMITLAENGALSRVTKRKGLCE